MAAPQQDQDLPTNDPNLQNPRDVRSDTISYDAQKMIGHGSFGAVFLAKVSDTDEVVAIKKVLQDRRFKNRELQIMRQLTKQPHPFIVTLKHHFVSKGSKSDDVYLNLVLEYIPETIYSVSKYFTRRKEYMPIFSVKLYMYQLCRSLAHIHGMGICHRDIKPHNLLVDPVRHILKLCDFGSAKAFVKGEPNVAYICSRFYRAPELILGATDYTTAIDVWSAGCVFAELLTGHPIFPGISGVDQLVEIIKILGTPSRDEVRSMNPANADFKYPTISGKSWNTIFRPSTTPDTIELIQRMLCYNPEIRTKSIEACAHNFFDELRLPTTTMPDRTPLMPELFTYTAEELVMATPDVVSVLQRRLPDGSLNPATTAASATPAVAQPQSIAAAVPPATAATETVVSATTEATEAVPTAASAATVVPEAVAPSAEAAAPAAAAEATEGH